MFKRLAFLLMLVTATMSVSPPAHAAGLTVTLVCDTSPAEEDWLLFIDCVARASGGISPYTFQWYRGTSALKTETTSGTSYYTGGCRRGSGTTRTFTVSVTDTRGAQGSASSTVTC
jgi:hypothetical protein